MSDRLTRKDIKHDIRHDEFTDTIQRVVHFATENARQLILGAVGLVVVALLVLGYVLYGQHRASQAAVALDEAMAVYDAPVDAAQPNPDDPDAPTFADEAARRARAEERFGEVVSSYGSTDAGKVATAYLGTLAARGGDEEKARQLWSEFLERSPGHALAVEVRLNLLRLDLAAGKGEEVAAELEQMLESGERPLPEDLVLFELAQVREELGRNDEALSAYQRILDEFPQSPYGQEAQQKVSSLQPLAAEAS